MATFKRRVDSSRAPGILAKIGNKISIFFTPGPSLTWPYANVYFGL